MFVIIFIFVIIMVIGILVINIYNKFIFYRGRVLDMFEVIDDLLISRVDIINSILDIIKDNKLHEEKVVNRLVKLKKAINEEDNINSRIELLDDDSIDKALELSKVYSKLENNKEFIKIRDSYNKNVDKVDYALDIYNEEVLNYNNYKDKKYNNIVFRKFKFMEYNYYEK